MPSRNRTRPHDRRGARGRATRPALLALLALVASPGGAHASLFEGETLDKVADVLSWIVLVLVPVVGIAVFWLVHILPEKIAEKRHHPQAKAIQVLCLLSLVFGGLLWPLAWLWAYTRPVLFQMAYGRDTEVHGAEPAPAPETREETRPGVAPEPAELALLRARIARLERDLARSSTPEGSS